MEIVLQGIQWETAVLYLDDVISVGRNFSDALRNLEQSKLFQKSVEFLGSIVSTEGVSCDPKKIEAVKIGLGQRM